MTNQYKSRGFTLLELIVSIALLTIVMVVFTSILGVGGKLGQETLLQTQQSMAAAGGLEQGREVEGEEASLILEFEGNPDSVRVNGEMLETQDGEVTYVKFKPAK